MTDDDDRRLADRESRFRLETKLDSLLEKITTVAIQQGQNGVLLERHTEQVDRSIKELKASDIANRMELRDYISDTRAELIANMREHSDHPAPHTLSIGNEIDEINKFINRAKGVIAFALFLGAAGTANLIHTIGGF